MADVSDVRLRGLALGATFLLAVMSCVGSTEFPASTTGEVTTTVPGPSQPEPVTSTTSLEASVQVSPRAQILKVDPRTLEPVPGFKPISLNDGGLAWASPAGEWLLVSTWNDGNPDDRFLLDTERWVIVARSELWGQPLAITDSGTVYVANGHPDPVIERRPLGSGEWERLTRLARPQALPYTMAFDGRRFGGLGMTDTDAQDLVPALLVVVDTTDGQIMKLALPTVLTGQEATDLEYENGSPIFRTRWPTLAWAGERGFVVHAHQDVVTEVDLTTGAIEDHVLRTETSLADLFLSWLTPRAQAKGPSPTTFRSAVANPDGSLLFISGFQRETSLDADGDLYESTPLLGVRVVDTSTWSVVATLDLPVGNLTGSPDGSFILGTGSTTEGKDAGPITFWGAGVYAIDSSTFETTHLDQDSIWETGVDFSADGRYAYLSYALAESNLNYIDVLDLTRLEIVATRSGHNLKLWGKAAVIAEWVPSSLAPD